MYSLILIKITIKKHVKISFSQQLLPFEISPYIFFFIDKLTIYFKRKYLLHRKTKWGMMTKKIKIDKKINTLDDFDDKSLFNIKQYLKWSLS